MTIKKQILRILVVMCVVLTLLTATAFTTKGGTVDVSSIASSKLECTCTVKCVVAELKQNKQASINDDCPICGLENANLANCNSKRSKINTVHKSVGNRTITLELEHNSITDKNGASISPSDGVYNMLATEGWKWDASQKVLTLEGANINVSSGAAISMPKDARIELVGENSVKDSATGAIRGRNTLTIGGEGSLSVEVTQNEGSCFFADTEVAITGGKFTLTSQESNAIYSSGKITVSGGDITTTGKYCGLQAEDDIKISGAKVQAKSKEDVAIFTADTLNIQNSAQVNVIGAKYAGINASQGITIIDSKVNSVSGAGFTSIYTPKTLKINGVSEVTAKGDFRGMQGEESTTIGGDARVTVEGKDTGLQSMDVQILDNAFVNATSTIQSAISGKTNLSITGNANVTANGSVCGILAENSLILSGKNIVAKGDTYYGVRNEKGAIVVGGKVTAQASEGHGISAEKGISGDSNADISATGSLSGITAKGDITFNSSKVQAIGNGGCGISTTGKINIANGNIHAKGSSGYAAIRTESVPTTTSETAESKISLTNVVEKNGAKVAFCNWVDNSNEKISWTTFISKNDNGLVTTPGGGFSNGLLEVWLGDPYTVTFDVNGGTGTNSTVKVYHGDNISAPVTKPSKAGCHFSGWSLNGVIFDFANTPVTGDITLKAQFDVHTFEQWKIDKVPTETEPGSKHRNCSVCAYRETAVIPIAPHIHTPSSEWSKDADNHWHNCIANDGQHMNEAAHTWDAGNETKPPTYTQYGVKTYICTVCRQTKTEIIPKLPSNSTIVDDCTSIKVENVNGSAFDPNIVLSVTSKPQAEMDELKDVVDKAVPGVVLGGLYDVKLLKDGVEIQPDGKIKVSIPLNEAMKVMTDLQVIFIDHNDKVSIIPSEIKDGMIAFVTDHFSYYGVIGKDAQKPTPPTPPAPAKIAAPKTVKTKALSQSSVKVTWNKVSKAKEYAVYLATSKTGKYTLAKKVKETTTTVDGLKANKTYYFKIRAKEDAGYGGYSKAVLSKTKNAPGAPSKCPCGQDHAKAWFKLKQSGQNTVKVTWTPQKGAKSYQVANNHTSSKVMKIKWMGNNRQHCYLSLGKSKGKNYQFKMRTMTVKHGKNIYGPWTSKVCITMK